MYLHFVYNYMYSLVPRLSLLLCIYGAARYRVCALCTQ